MVLHRRKAGEKTRNKLTDTCTKNKVIEFEKIHDSGDPRRALEFERSILKMARDEFDLITAIEYLDLVRLQDDRNRCAHPSIQSLDEIYEAPAELARNHLRNAVIYLLQHPPVQGKVAMSRLIAEVNSEYFPKTQDEAISYFETGPLARPRESLVRNFVIYLSKELILQDPDAKAGRRYLAALGAVRSMHREIAEAALDEKLNGIMQQLKDETLANGVRFVCMVSDTWQYVEEDVRLRMSNFVLAMPDENLAPHLARVLAFSPLRAFALQRLAQVNAAQLDQLIQRIHPSHRDLCADRAVDLYGVSASFAEAKFRGTHLIIPLAHHLQAHHVEHLVGAIAVNDQLRLNWELEDVLRAIRNAEIIPAQQLDELLTQQGLPAKTQEEVF
jgi:hypothetical protein